MMPPRVLVLHNEPVLPADHPDAESEHDILYTADVVTRTLQQAGIPAARLGVSDDMGPLVPGLKAHRPDVVFNLYEGTAKWGNTEAYVAGVLEWLRLPFTGSPVQPILLARSKPLTKHLLAGAGLPTARFFAVESGPCPENALGWPVIVKPGKEDASVGIDQASVCTSQDQLAARVEYVLKTYGPPALVEQFVRGREFNVAIVERDGVPEVLPFSEIVFLDADDSPHWPIVSFDAKWRPGTRDFAATPAKNPAEVEPALHDRIAGLAKRAYELAGCRDYARVDFRVTAAGEPYILEVNPNPCISPLAGLAAALETAKIAYPDFILGLVRAALRRGPKPELADAVGSATVPAPAAAVELHWAKPARRGWKVRPARAADRDGVYALIRGLDGFAVEEKKALLEQVRRLLGRKMLPDGGCFVLAGRGRLGGVAVVRPADGPHAARTLALLAVAPDLRRQGWGAELLRAAEGHAAGQGGRILLAELSSGAAFAGFRQFLLRHDFRQTGDVPDFYKDGCSRLAFARHLPAPAQPAAPAEPARVGRSSS